MSHYYSDKDLKERKKTHRKSKSELENIGSSADANTISGYGSKKKSKTIIVQGTFIHAVSYAFVLAVLVTITKFLIFRYIFSPKVYLSNEVIYTESE